MKEKKKRNFSFGKYLKKHIGGFIGYLALDITAAVATVLMTMWFAKAATFATLENPEYTKAIYTFLICTGLYIIRRTCWYCSNLVYNTIVNKIIVEINYDVANQVFKLQSKTFSDNNTGTFVQRMVNEPNNVIQFFGRVVDMFTSVITALVIVVYISTLNIYIGLVIFGTIAIASVIEWYRTKRFRKNQKIVNKKGDKVNSISTEIIRSEMDIKSLGLEEKLSDVQRDCYSDFKKASFTLAVTEASFAHLKQIILEFGGAALLIVGVLLMGSGKLGDAVAATGAFMLLFSNYNQLYGLAYNFGHIIDMFTRIKISAERMSELFDESKFASEKFGTTHLDSISGNIEFQRVNFSYVEFEEPNFNKMSRKERRAYKKNPPEKTIKSQNNVFKNLSFKIKANTTVAFVGRSGSGKSTILNLMSKMYEVDSGKVLIDGVNINDLDKSTLRSNISLVNQFPYIFDMSIRENLLLAKKDATEEEIMDALNKASLSEFIASIPEGIDARVGESGIKLSGGQKQRLAIARALLRQSPIIIFDESTSSLDNFAQEDIKHSIDSLKGHGTIVIVAHRLSTIRNADQIFFLDEGKIVDIGTFDELFANNAKFKNMFFAENIE